jgi:hypothetical protein
MAPATPICLLPTGRIKFLLPLAFIFIGFHVYAGVGVSVELLRKHISYLAADSLQGRGTGTAGARSAARYIAEQMKAIGLKPSGANGSYLKPFSFKKSANPHGDETDPKAVMVESENIAGVLDVGSAKTIVVGAHYDHLGLGHDKNSLDANPEGKIHPGADDNASGVAGVLELARILSERRSELRCNVLFLCFSGEELGLYGSKRWVQDASFDSSRIHLMVNMDMIGRLNDSTRKVMVYGIGTAAGLGEAVKAHAGTLSLQFDSSGVGPSDHTSFYLKSVPVLHYFTGQHSDYHKPGDVASKINYAGEKEVLESILGTVLTLDAGPPLAFRKTRDSQQDAPRFKVTLGIMPDYTFEGPGVRADGVSEQKPAGKAGLAAGDVVVQMDAAEVKDMQTYMKALAQYKKGDRARVKVMRKGEEKWFDVIF